MRFLVCVETFVMVWLHASGSFYEDERKAEKLTHLSNGETVKIEVACYSGHKADERPIKFSLGNTVLFVDSIQDQWYGNADSYFRVLADDGNTYVIVHNEITNEWTLESFRAQTSPSHLESGADQTPNVH
jgi:hypothetical protein